MALTARDYRDLRDLRAMQRLAQDAWPLARRHIGGLAWNRLQHVGREREWATRLWADDGRTVAWGWTYLPGHLELLIQPERLELVDAVIEWFEAVAEAAELSVTAVAQDSETCAALELRGYEVAPDSPFFALLERGLEDLPEPAVPEGYTLRTVRGKSDLAARVAVHRAAWEPSRVTAESYRNVMEAWPYRPDLDCVVEVAAGLFAAAALAWFDEANRVGELEPVGTHPNHRQRGLARAVCLFALHRLREAGATRASVGARGDQSYPLPRLIYQSIGFEQTARTVEYRRVR